MQPFEIVGDPAAGGPFVFTCEHVSNRLPDALATPEDRRFLDDHWGFDVGAADLTRGLAERTRSCAVLADFSRLLCDPNRDPGAPDFVVEAVEGHRLSFNRGVDAAERRRRQTRLFDPYHDAVDRSLRARRAAGGEFRLCAVHSFTPVYLGRRRPMEMGVLFDAWDEHAWRLEGALAEQGFETALNAPYSGHDGLVYSASRHGRAFGLVYLELEVRQDLIDAPARAGAVAERIARALAVFAPPS
jgi:predicted N-formylglutamate amidohydrolase